MKKLLLAVLSVGFALPAAATPVSFDTAWTEELGYHCERGLSEACLELVKITNGNCAGPVNSGCKYRSDRFISSSNSLMVNVPNFGVSRLETVTFCLKEAGVENYQDMITDSHFDYFEGCMIEMT